MSLPRRLVRTVFTFLNGLRLALRKVTGPGRAGVHGVPLTAQGKVVLVRLTYAPGWRIPGGGRGRREEPEQAMLRELREEIGMVSHGSMDRVEDDRTDLGETVERATFFLIRDVVYRPRRSLEVAEIREFDTSALPEDTTSWTAHLVGRCVDPRLPAAPRAGG